MHANVCVTQRRSAADPFQCGTDTSPDITGASNLPVEARLDAARLRCRVEIFVIPHDRTDVRTRNQAGASAAAGTAVLRQAGHCFRSCPPHPNVRPRRGARCTPYYATAPEATETRIAAHRGPPLRVLDAAQVPATRQSQSRSPYHWRPSQAKAKADMDATGARGVRNVTAHRGVRKVTAHGVWLARHRTQSHRTQRCAEMFEQGEVANRNSSG